MIDAEAAEARCIALISEAQKFAKEERDELVSEISVLRTDLAKLESKFEADLEDWSTHYDGFVEFLSSCAKSFLDGHQYFTTKIQCLVATRAERE